MYKRFWLIGTLSLFLCGFVLHIAYESSGAAAWSLLVSGVNNSPWELVKPFAIVYMMWTFIELSVLRPSLLHFVCARIISLLFFILSSLSVLSAVYLFIAEKWLSLAVLFVLTFISQALCNRLYASKCRFELFWLPLIASVFVVLACILVFSFYPPTFVFFLDPVSHGYGMIQR